MAYVYSHYRKDNNEIFYVGISSNNSGVFLRANDKNKRSKFWKSIVAKHGLSVRIIHESLDWENAKLIEIELIKKYGRLNNGSGVLCNLTDGGDGCLGFLVSSEYRQKLSASLKGKNKRFGEKNHFYGKSHTLEARQKISASLKKSDKNKGVNNPNYGKRLSEEQRKKMSIMRTGTKHSEESKMKIREWGRGRPKSEEWKLKISGKNNWMYGNGSIQAGEKNHKARRCVFIKTGEIFNCLKTGCNKKKVSYNTELAYIKPHHIRHKNRKFNYL